MRRGLLSLLVLALVASLTALLWNPGAARFEELKKKPVVHQLATRECPARSPDVVIEQGIQKMPFGPYQLTYETNFLQIDAHRFHKRGDQEIVGGVARPMPVDWAVVHITALGPDMIPMFMANSAAIRKQARGDLYGLSIWMFWSEDGSRRPPDYEKNGGLEGEEPPLSRTDTLAGLEEHELSPWSGKRRRYVPQPDLAAEFPFRILCTAGWDDAAGTCHVTRRPRADVWISYSFGSENLKCWRQIDKDVLDLVGRFTQEWSRNPPLQ